MYCNGKRRSSPSDILPCLGAFDTYPYSIGARVNLGSLTHPPQPRTYRASSPPFQSQTLPSPFRAHVSTPRRTPFLGPKPTNQATNQPQQNKTNKHAMATVGVVRCLRPRPLPRLFSCGSGCGVRSLQSHPLPQLQLQTRRTLSVAVKVGLPVSRTRTRLGGLVGRWSSGHDRIHRISLGDGGLGRFVGAVGGCVVGCADLGVVGVWVRSESWE